MGLNMVKDDSLFSSVFFWLSCVSNDSGLSLPSVNSYWPSRLRHQYHLVLFFVYRTSRNCSRVRGMEERLTGRADQLQLEIEEIDILAGQCLELDVGNFEPMNLRSFFINKISGITLQLSILHLIFHFPSVDSNLALESALQTECSEVQNSVGPALLPCCEVSLLRSR